MKRNFQFLIFASAISIGFVSCGRQLEETKPVRKDITLTVFASGYLEADATYNLTAQTDGQLIAVNFSEGDLVSKGDLLAVIENNENIYNTQSASALFQIAQSNTRSNAPALAQSANNTEAAKQKMLLDSAQYKRFEMLAAKNAVSLTEFENIRLQYANSKINYRNALETWQLMKQDAEKQRINTETQDKLSRLRSGNNELRALFNGKVYEKRKQPGDFVKRGDVIAVIGDASRILARVSVDESNIGKVQTGQIAEIQLNTKSGKIYKGQVTEILPAFDQSAQSFICKIEFTDSLDFRITGTQLQSNIVVDKHKNALLIPRRFLQYDGTVNVKDRKEPVAVKAEFTGSEWVEIIQGITDTDVLITEKTGR